MTIISVCRYRVKPINHTGVDDCLAQYEFIWDISNDNKSSNPKDWDRPRKITNLHKIVIKERALHMVLDDPNVCDDIKDYWWSQEYDILKNNKFRVSSRCPNFLYFC